MGMRLGKISFLRWFSQRIRSTLTQSISSFERIILSVRKMSMDSWHENMISRSVCDVLIVLLSYSWEVTNALRSIVDGAERRFISDKGQLRWWQLVERRYEPISDHIYSEIRMKCCLTSLNISLPNTSQRKTEKYSSISGNISSTTSSLCDSRLEILSWVRSIPSPTSHIIAIEEILRVGEGSWEFVCSRSFLFYFSLTLFIRSPLFQRLILPERALQRTRICRRYMIHL